MTMLEEESLNRLSKIGLTDLVAKKLVEHGIQCVSQIAMIPIPKLKAFLEDMDLGDETVKSIHKKATTLKNVIDNHLSDTN